METTIPPSPKREPDNLELMGCLEMELDHDEYDDEEDSLLTTTTNGSIKTINIPVQIPAPMVDLAQGLVTYFKLWIQLYPRLAAAIGFCLFLLILITWAPFRTRHAPDMTRNHVERDYAKLSTNYDLRKAQIHHWCLFGGNDNCYCEDPTQGASREETKGWSVTHTHNKHHINDNPVVQAGGSLDVVFYGAEVFQAWGEGKFLDRGFDEGAQIATYFNQTFRSPEAEIQGMALGIYTDRSTNLLWRLRHGEMPTNLQSKIFWILIGADDLALAMCSEDVVILGILRVAEEIAYHHPDSKIVIQGLMPRSNHKDGSLHVTDEKRGSSFRQSSQKNEPFDKNNIWASRTDQMNRDKDNLDPGHSTTASALWQAQEQAKQPYFDYYIWPSILEINKELKGFCEQSETDQFEYFDADDLFVESVGPEQRVKRDYMPNSILLSYQGHKVLIDSVAAKVQELLQEFD